MTTATATVLLCDAVDSPGHRSRLGRVEDDHRLLAHEQLLREVVASRSGRVLTRAGDGVMAVFAAASDGVAAAVAIQQSVQATTPEPGPRIGVAAGDVTWEGDDCFGLPVVVAARLESVCEPGGILVSAIVRHMAGDRTSADYTPIGALEFEGVPGPTEAYAVIWDQSTRAQMAGADGWRFPATLPLATRFPFVGRDAEQRELDALWSQAREGGRGGSY